MAIGKVRPESIVNMVRIQQATLREPEKFYAFDPTLPRDPFFLGIVASQQALEQERQPHRKYIHWVTCRVIALRRVTRQAERQFRDSGLLFRDGMNMQVDEALVLAAATVPCHGVTGIDPAALIAAANRIKRSRCADGPQH